MADEKGGAGAGGTPPSDGSGTGGGSGGSPPVGEPPKGGGAPGASGISLEVLPEELRGLPEKQIKYLLDTTFSSLKTINARNKELEERLKATPPGGSKPADLPLEEGGEPAASKGPPLGKDGKPKSLEEWLLEDSKSALAFWAEQQFGPAFSRLKKVEGTVGDAVFDSVKREFSDFAEHEEDVKVILKESNAEKTRDNILGAYTMVVGRKALLEKDLRRRKELGGGDTPPSDGGAPPAASYDGRKTPLTEEVRIASGLTEEEYYDKFAHDKPLAVKLPGEK